MSEQGVRARIDAMRKCKTPEVHDTYQPTVVHGDLIVAESLNPDDRLFYETCGLCAGFRRYLTRKEYEAHE